MTHEQIESFLAVVKYGSITAAAKAMYITQPALSKRIADLEYELGNELIKRRKGIRTVTLTQFGQNFIPIAQKWDALWSETKDLLQPHLVKELHISATASAGYTIIPSLYRKLHEYNKALKIHLKTSRFSNSYPELIEGSLDLALLVAPTANEDVMTIAIAEEPLTFVCNIDSDYPQIIALSSLSSSQEVVMPLSPEFTNWHEKHLGPTSDCFIQTDNFYITEQFIIQNDAWSILPESIATNLEKQGLVRIGYLSPPPPPRIIYASYTSKLNSDYRDFILQTLRAIAEENEYLSPVDPKR